MVPLPVRRRMADERVLAALDELGYRHVGWDVDPEDWNETHGAADVERLVLEGVRCREEDTIVLLHAWPIATAEALPAILEALGSDGVERVTVDALREGFQRLDSPLQVGVPPVAISSTKAPVFADGGADST